MLYYYNISQVIMIIVYIPIYTLVFRCYQHQTMCVKTGHESIRYIIILSLLLYLNSKNIKTKWSYFKILYKI